MNLVVTILAFVSLSFWVMGIGLLVSKKFRNMIASDEKLKRAKIKKIDEYVKFNAISNIGIGLVTTGLTLLANFFQGYILYISIAYIICIYGLSMIQMKLTKKYS